MRELKISHWELADSEIDLLLEAAKSKIVSPDEQMTLLQGVRNGNAKLIPKLVDSCEVMILSVIRGYLDEGSSIEEMIDISREALTKIAHREMYSNRRESFFRFGTWVVRQNILNINFKRNKLYKK
ncbi:MAG: hypothetical protein ACYCZO_10230 [Daejeonella sp.]